jgi:UDP-glucose 4-epimerase
MIGEDPCGLPNNLMPLIAQVAVGKRKKLFVFGGDYATPDGTARRDYIHVEDLAAGHLAALKGLSINDNPFITVNLGTGKPFSVLEMIRAFQEASSKPVPFEVIGRRSGDIAEYYADPMLARKLLGWKAQLDIDRICEDTWRWQINNPDGFD